MNGNYIYVMYVIKKTEQEDMYSSSGDVDISLINTGPGLINPDPESSIAILVRKLYHMILPDEPVQDPHLVSIFHCA